jgi:hypothetical protein
MMMSATNLRPALDGWVSSAEPAIFVPRISACQEKKITKLTICNGTVCKLYGAVPEGEFLGGRGRIVRIAVERG